MWPTKEILEVEFKFVPEGTEHDTVAELASTFGPEYGFVRWPPCANLDIYLDTPDLALHEANTPLRLRMWGTPFRHKKAVLVNFKYPPEIRDGLRRHELKTLLPRAQAGQVCHGAIIGTAMERAAEIARDRTGAAPEFTPQLMITCFQSNYILRKRTRSDDYSVTRGRAADLMWLSFEHCTTRAVGSDSASRLISNGNLDYDPAQPTAEFFETELEITAPAAELARTEELYGRAYRMVAASGACMPLRSKYAAATQLIRGVREGGR
jgi:hypothetical protein